MRIFSLFLILFFSFLSTFVPLNCMDKKVQLPGREADLKTIEKISLFLNTLGHKSPSEIHVRFDVERLKQKKALGLWDPKIKTIFVKEDSDEFTMAHEVVHATFDLNAHKLTQLIEFSLFISLLLPCNFAGVYVIHNKAMSASFSLLSYFFVGVLEAFCIMPLAYKLRKKLYDQNIELRADVKAAELLLALDKKAIVSKQLEDLQYIVLLGLELNGPSWWNKLTRQYHGFYIKKNQQGYVLDKEAGCAENFFSNWGTHPTVGKACFAIQKVLDAHKAKRDQFLKKMKGGSLGFVGRTYGLVSFCSH